MVTASKTPKRARLQAREASTEFLDAGAKVGVCKREDFVGRRRSIQRCLRTLQSREGDEQYAEGVLIHGIGGIGKSSLAARVCERMSGHKRMVFVGALDELGFIGRISGGLNDPEAIRLLNEPGLNLTQQLRNLLAVSLSTQPFIFVLDDFEQNLEASGGGYVAKSAPLEIMKSLLTAIRETGSESRVIATSRYKFPLPSPLKLREEALESLRGGELEKKLTRLKAFDPSSSIDEKTRERARALGAGNPRLLEWLDKVMVDRATDETLIMDAMEPEAERFRENVLLSELLSQVTVECRRMMALASIYEMPFDRQAVAVAVDGPLDPHLGRAVSLGLVEGGTDPATGESRYLVSRLALPLIEKETTEEERTEAARRAAKYLYQARWQTGTGVGEEEAKEIFRLAMEAREQEIALGVGSKIADRLVNSNRYREAELLCQRALSLGEDYRLLLNLARAQFVLGRTIEAQRNYERALSLCPDSDVSEKSGIIHNLANLVDRQGDVERAIGLWQESLALSDRIGDVEGKASTLHKMAIVIAQQGDVERAIGLWQESLALEEQIDDVPGKASTLSVMADVISRQGNVERAIGLWQESLALSDRIGDVGGKASTLRKMAGVIADQGDVERAIGLWQESRVLFEQIGDVQGKADTLREMAWAIVDQEDVEQSIRLLQESLALEEQIGDVQGKASTLFCVGWVIALQGDVNRAIGLWQESRVLFEQIGDVQGKAATLHIMGWLASKNEDFDEARRLYIEAGKSLATVRAWLDLITVLSNLAHIPTEGALGFLAQAAWLAIRVESPAEETLNMIKALLEKLGTEHETAPLLAAAAVFIARTRGQRHPDHEKLINDGMNMLRACAAARKIEQEEQFQQWLAANGLDDLERFRPALSSSLEAMVGDGEWLFDRKLFEE
jgi:tetratricopeptide (TPR) repeat protein